MTTFASKRAPLAAVIVTVALAGGCSGAAPAAHRAAPRPSPSRAVSRVTPTSPSPAPTRGSPSALPGAAGAGALPQTRALPSTGSAAFRDAMQDVWQAVTSGDARVARPAFFPLAAYRKLKAIPDPTTDWNDRLWHDFTLDVAAAHRLVGPDARLARVIVANSDAAWVSPGACANSIGYWHVPGSRLVYRQHGRERSIGIASLISWRGVWYVVHFGAVLRSTAVGVVDDPEAGSGRPGPAGGC